MNDALLAIAKTVREKRCLFFLGSGLAAEAGLPTATKLGETLLQDIPGPAVSTNLTEIAQDYTTVHSTRALKELIQTEIQHRIEVGNLDLTTYKLIARLPQTDFITTNWDTLLEDSFKPSEIRTIFLDEEAAFWNSARKNILKIHGCVRSPSSIVVTRREYESFQQTHPHFVRKLTSLFAERSLVLCGYSMEDRTFRDLYREATKTLSSTGVQVYWVDPYARDRSADEWAEFGVRRLPATARDFFETLLRMLGDTANSSTLQVEGRSAQDLFLLVRQLLETEKTFSILEDDEIFEYDFFKTKIVRCRILIENYANDAPDVISRMNEPQLEKLKTYNDSLKSLPVRIHQIINNNSANVRVSNPQSIVILLKDLIESCTGPLARVETAIRRHRQVLSGTLFDTVSRKGPTEEFTSALSSLVRKRGLAEFSEFLALLIERTEEVADFVADTSVEGEPRRHLLKRLWQHFDIVLLNEMFRAEFRQSRLLRAILASDEAGLVRKVSFIIASFSEQAEKLGILKAVELRRQLVRVSSDGFDRSVILRCLTFHLYNGDVRKFAVKTVNKEALWTLISLENYPIWALVEAASYLLEEEGDDAAKLLLDVKCRDLLSMLDAESSFLGSVRDLEEFLVLFGASPVLLLDSYHDIFSELVRRVATRSGGQRNPQFVELNDVLRKGAGQLGPAGPPGERSFRRLPSFVKSRLASNMLYLIYFVTSEDDEVALLAGNIIKDSNFAAKVLLSRRINPALLAWISKRKSLMVSYSAKRALLFNPKTQVDVASRFINQLRSYDMELLGRSRDVNPSVRQLALNRLRRV